MTENRNWIYEAAEDIQNRLKALHNRHNPDRPFNYPGSIPIASVIKHHYSKHTDDVPGIEHADKYFPSNSPVQTEQQ